MVLASKEFGGGALDHVLGGRELDGIENRDGQLSGMLDGTAEELVIGG